MIEMHFVFGVAGVAALVQSLFGALPPWAVQSLRHRECVARANAPELLQVKVVRIRAKTTWCPRRRRHAGRSFRAWRYKDLTVLARVTKVTKSASGLKVGAMVRFSYSIFHLCPHMTGPANRPQPRWLGQGEAVWVFLRHREGDRFGLAAGAASLTPHQPNIGSKAHWLRHCDRLYPRRGRR